MKVKACCFIVYQEDNLIDSVRRHLNYCSYSAAISPLHSPDEDDKKPHYHVVVTLPSPRELGAISKEFIAISSNLRLFPCRNVAGYTRYLTHLDNPEKQQFDVLPEIIGGFSYSKFVFRKIADCDYATVIDSIKSFISDNEIFSFAAYVNFLCYEKNLDLLEWVVSHSYFVNQYINSLKCDRGYYQ